MTVEASAASGRECIFFQTNAFDSMVVPDSLEPGTKKVYSSYEEYYAAERKIFDSQTRGLTQVTRGGGSSPLTPSQLAERERGFEAKMKGVQDSGSWKDAKWLEDQEKSRSRHYTQRPEVKTKDANKFEEKRANISLASSTALTMQTSSANLTRQNVMRSIAGGENVV
jgi:hypothetical protein